MKKLLGFVFLVSILFIVGCSTAVEKSEQTCKKDSDCERTDAYRQSQGGIADSIAPKIFNKCIRGQCIQTSPSLRKITLKTKVVIDKGDSEILRIGINNKNKSILNYKLRFNPIRDINGSFSIENPDWFQYNKSAVYQLEPEEFEARSITLNIPMEANIGQYFLQFEVINADLSPSDNIYATQDFFIVIK